MILQPIVNARSKKEKHCHGSELAFGWEPKMVPTTGIERRGELPPCFGSMWSLLHRAEDEEVEDFGYNQ